jgi:hypothetical protein
MIPCMTDRKPVSAAQGIFALAAAGLVMAGLYSCSSDSSPPAFPDGYSPLVKDRIAQQVAMKDCAGLQAGFDAADANGGPRAGDLMAFIDDAMKRAACH